MKYNKVLQKLLLAVCISSNLLSANAISIVDDRIPFELLKEESKKELRIEGEYEIYKKYKNEKILIKNTGNKKEIHIFEKKGERYLISYYISEGSVKPIYVPYLTFEPLVYKNEGFPVMPTKHVSNTPDYSFYVDQRYTGYAAENNCGPSTIEMVLNWKNLDNKVSAKDLRENIPNSGGWWYEKDIKEALRSNNVQYVTESIKNKEKIREIIDRGDVAIFCVDTKKFIHNGDKSSRINSFYEGKGGHFVLVTGYAEIENELYFETMDPDSWGTSVVPNEIKGLNEAKFSIRKENGKFADNMTFYGKVTRASGKGRYFEGDSFVNAIKDWYPYVFAVKK